MFNFRNAKIATRIPAIIIAGSLATGLAVGAVSYFSASSALEAETEAKFSGLLESRKAALATYMDSIREDLRFMAANPRVKAALRSYKFAWSDLGADAGRQLQKLYIDDNPFPTGKKEGLDAADDGSSYSDAHRRFHPWFRKFLRERDYYDIFLFDMKGDLVYTVFKERDYATNLVTGKWKDTDLGNAFRAARDNPKGDFQAFYDFRPYAPSYDAPAGFIATAILDDQGKPVGVLAFHMPIHRLNTVMQVEAGLGETGETYLVGADYLMRSDSRLAKESTILKREVRTEPVRRALAGERGTMEIERADGERVMSSYSQMDVLGTRWVVLVEESLAEATAQIVAMRDRMLMVTAAVVVAIGAIGFFLSRGIVRALTGISGTMEKLADGDKTVEVPGLERGDEIGEMAQAVEVFKRNAIDKERLEALNAEDQAARERRAQAMAALIEKFDGAINTVLATVATAVQSLETTAQGMLTTAQQTTEQATSAAAASEEASTNAATVASAAEELSNTINEVSSQVSKTSDAARQAESQAVTSNERVGELADQARKIGDVVSLISEIAEQTNLLALNATIEAARAGDAGKGFAVVASEVKELASQTAKATEEISTHISGIQTVTGEAVTAMKGIGETIESVNTISASVAAAMTEQQSATEEIARSIQQAAEGTNEVSANITGVSQAATETTDSANKLTAAAMDLSEQSNSLRKEVEGFLAEVRAA